MSQKLTNLARLVGKRILVVEDQWLLAEDTALALEAQGAIVVGPAPSVASAFALLNDSMIDAAVLDILLGDDVVYPLAEHLQQQSIPFVFATSERAANIPAQFAGYVVSAKPVDLDEIAGGLFGNARAR